MMTTLQGRTPKGAGGVPKRKPFAIRVVRLLTKAAVATEIGPEVCWLLTVVAHTQDARHYAGPVNFWNEQLAPSAGLKSLAKELSVPVLAFCQLNREADGCEPRLSHLRDSGSIEQDADVVLFIHRDDTDKTVAKLIVAKHRHGDTGTIALAWDAPDSLLRPAGEKHLAPSGEKTTRLRGVHRTMTRTTSMATAESLVARCAAVGIVLQVHSGRLHYIRGIKQFSRWLKLQKRTPDDALAALAGFNAETDRRYVRREMTPDEVAYLLRTVETYTTAMHNMPGPDRAMAYRVALGTGFRAKELRSLTPASFDLDADPPTVTVTRPTASGDG